jgi:2-succinyl-5-enolpyruvyl-6-hydroxy-3-cyclohexene-1-carboxylate synthase
MTEQTRRFISGTHTTSAKSWAIECGFHYIAARNNEELTGAVCLFTQTEPTAQPVLLEVFTEQTEDIRLLDEYYRAFGEKPK